MSQAWKTPLAALLATSFVLLLGCGNGNRGFFAPAPGAHVMVTGEVIAFDDQVPADGGATITVNTAAGGAVRLLFPSLHTSPPPSQQTIDLYDLVRRVQVGDLIRAEGRHAASGVEIESLAILERRP